MGSDWQEVEDDAWDCFDEGDYRRAKILAEKVITLNIDAIDSYVILAQTTDVLGVKIAFAREAVEIGGRVFRDAIKKRPYKEFFWGSLETRPYMRAILTLSLALWDDERPDGRSEAIKLAQYALKICPNDNIGFRILLLNWLASEQLWDEGWKLAKKCKHEARAAISFPVALYAFQANDEQADELLAEAIASNQHIRKLILGKKAPTFEPDDGGGWGVVMGSKEEAAEHVARWHHIWCEVDGAREWLLSQN